MRKLFIYLLSPLFIMSMTSCSKMEGDVLMTYTKAIPTYGDIDSLRALPLIVPQRPIENPVGFFVSKDFILVGERGKGIHIFENLNMMSPRKMSFLQIPFNKEFYVKDGILYAESGYDFLKIDISDVYNARITSRLHYAFHNGFKNDKGQLLLGFDYENVTEKIPVNGPEAREIRRNNKIYLDYKNQMIPFSNIPAMFVGDNGNSKGTMNRISIHKNHVYVVTSNKMFVFLDNFRGDLRRIAEIKITDQTETIFQDMDRLYLGSTSNMEIYGIGNPSFPNKLGEFQHVESCDPILASGNVAYFTLRNVASEGCNNLGENTLNVVDVSNPRNIKEIETFTLKSPYGLTEANERLFVGQGESGLTIFDIKNKKSPKKLKHFSHIKAYDVMISPIDPNIIIVSNKTGVQQYNVNWNNMVMTLSGNLNYK